MRKVRDLFKLILGNSKGQQGIMMAAAFGAIVFAGIQIMNSEVEVQGEVFRDVRLKSDGYKALLAMAEELSNLYASKGCNAKDFIESLTFDGSTICPKRITNIETAYNLATTAKRGEYYLIPFNGDCETDTTVFFDTGESKRKLFIAFQTFLCQRPMPKEI